MLSTLGKQLCLFDQGLSIHWGVVKLKINKGARGGRTLPRVVNNHETAVLSTVRFICLRDACYEVCVQLVTTRQFPARGC